MRLATAAGDDFLVTTFIFLPSKNVCMRIWFELFTDTILASRSGWDRLREYDEI